MYTLDPSKMQNALLMQAGDDVIEVKTVKVHQLPMLSI